MEVLNICTINFLNNTIWCVPEKHCCIQENRIPIWQSWYTWFAIALLFLFLFTSLLAYFGNACKKKQQNLIRIRNFSEDSEEPNVISTITGPGGIIQPDLRHLGKQTRVESSTVVEIPDSRTKGDQNYAKPLSPPYPPVEPITIIKGSAPPEGYRQTNSYTDIVLPPGFIDSDHYKP